MAEASEAMKAMAERIAESVVGSPRNGLDGAFFMAARDAALAAIIETQRADAELAEHWIPQRYDDTDIVANDIATAIRTGNHYAKDENNG